MKRQMLLSILFAGALLCGSAPLAMINAQDYPVRPVKMIVPSGAGSGPDVIARIVADRLSDSWGQQVVVENRPGASGAIAVRAAGTSVPDGYTLYFAIASNFITLATLQPDLQFEVGRDFVPIGLVGEQPMVIAATPSLGVKSLPELVALTKKHPGEVNCAVLSRLTLPHLAAELVRMASGAELTVVSYPANSNSLTDVLGGRVQVTIDGLSGLSSAIATGSITPLAVTSPRRLPNFPDMPTVSESLPGVQAMGWFALMAPPGSPEGITRKASEDLRAILAQPELQQRFQQLGTFVHPMTPAELINFIHGEQDLWKPVLAQANAKSSN